MNNISLYRVLRLIVASSLVTAAAWATPNGAVSQRASTQNPDNPINNAIARSTDRAIDAAMRGIATHAANESEGFRYPAVFVDYGYGKVDDSRPGGAETTTHSGTIGMDFTTFADFFVGAMYTYSDFDGKISNAPDDEGDTNTFSLYASKMIGNMLFAGVSVSYSDDDSDLGTETETYSIAPYVSFIIIKDDWKYAITPTYSLSMAEADNAAGTDTSTRGEFLLNTRATYMAQENLDLYVGATLHQVIHSHLLDAENGQDHTWVATSVGAKYDIDENLSAEIVIGYDAFNSEFDSNVNGRLSLLYAF